MKNITEYFPKQENEFMQDLADSYITEQDQKEKFLRQKGVWTKIRLNYITGLILKERETFSPNVIV